MLYTDPSTPREAAFDAARLAVTEKRFAIGCGLLVSVAVFLTVGRGFAGMGARIALLLFPLTGVFAWLLVPNARMTKHQSRQAIHAWLWVGLPLLAYFLTALAGLLIHGDSTSVLDKPVRMLVLSGGLFVWLHLRFDRMTFQRVVVVMSILGGVLALAVAGYERFGLGIDRVGAEIFPIQFADITMSISLICVVWAIGLEQPLRGLAALGATFSLLACWMAASRGAFVALMALPWIVGFASGKRLTTSKALAVLGVAGAVLAVGLAANSGLRARLGDMGSDLRAYSQGNPNTSLGMRLQMWDNSLHVFAGSPFFGVGSRGYMEAQQRGVDEGRLHPAIMEFNGAHNQFIDALAKGGLLHGLSTLALFAVPWLWFLHFCRRSHDVPLHAVAGFAVTSAFPLFALSQHVLNHSSGAMFFAGGVVLFALAAGPRYGTMNAPTASTAAPGTHP
ncbi:MAG: O-antigen ligase family protein [Comamonadaceae bacterium]|nr:MAG: O-antigen ligase family protein [Comamonadaceae bacterium]